MITVQPSLFAGLDAPEDGAPVGFLFACPAGHAKRHNLPRCAAPSVIRCRCGRPARGVEIRGTRTGHRCDARCMFATGPDCLCACGGRNHGIGHG